MSLCAGRRRAFVHGLKLGADLLQRTIGRRGLDAGHERHQPGCHHSSVEAPSRDVPAFLCGRIPNNMAKSDERVGVEEYLHMVRTHAVAAAAFLSFAE